MWSQRIRTKRWQSLTTLNVLYDPCLAKNCDTGSKEKRRQREEKTNQNKSLDFTREMFTMLKRCQSRASDLQLLQTSMICNCPQQFFRHCHHLEFLRIFFWKGDILNYLDLPQSLEPPDGEHLIIGIACLSLLTQWHLCLHITGYGLSDSKTNHIIMEFESFSWRSVGLDLDGWIIPLRLCKKVTYTSGIKFLFPACTTTLNRLQSLGPSPAYDHDWKLEILGQRFAFSRQCFIPRATFCRQEPQPLECIFTF